MTLGDRDRGRGQDAAFERLLLDAARDDAVPAAASTAAAWANLAASAGVTSALGPGQPRAAALAAGSKTAATSGAVKWLILGALGGSALTAGWMSRQTRLAAPVEIHGAAMAPAERVPEPAAAPERSVADPRDTDAALERAALEGGEFLRRGEHGMNTGEALAAGASPRRGVNRAHAARRAPPTAGAKPASSAVATAAPDSSLEREVAALDAASAALAAERVAHALGLLAQYRRDFARGELARDADVLEIEALSAQGERDAALRHAERFLSVHPSDLHAPRVRALRAALQPASFAP